MFTQKNALARAKEFLGECTKLPVKIDRAILFGSFANGKPNENSDIDLALFSEKFSDNILKNIVETQSKDLHRRWRQQGELF